MTIDLFSLATSYYDPATRNQELLMKILGLVLFMFCLSVLVLLGFLYWRKSYRRKEGENLNNLSAMDNFEPCGISTYADSSDLT